MDAQTTHERYRRIAAGRQLTRQTQAELAEELMRVTGRHWSRVMVARLESGEKPLDVDTVFALSEISGLPIEFYLYGPSATVPISPIPGYIKSDDDYPADDLLLDRAA